MKLSHDVDLEGHDGLLPSFLPDWLTCNDYSILTVIEAVSDTVAR